MPWTPSEMELLRLLRSIGVQSTLTAFRISKRRSRRLSVYSSRGAYCTSGNMMRECLLHYMALPELQRFARILLFQQSFQRLSSQASKSCPMCHHMAVSCCLLVAALTSGTPQSTKSTSQCKSDIVAPPHRLLIDINFYTFLS